MYVRTRMVKLAIDMKSDMLSLSSGTVKGPWNRWRWAFDVARAANYAVVHGYEATLAITKKDA